MKITDAMVDAAESMRRERNPMNAELDRMGWVSRKAMRAALEAALAADPVCDGVVAENATTDAAFAAALDDFGRAFAKRTGPYFNCYGTNDKYCAIAVLDSARARVEALHADARNAGLREVRAWLENVALDWSALHPQREATYNEVAEHIGAMLGGDGE